MQRLAFSILVLATCSIGAWGQANNGHSGQGYVFFAPGAISPGGGGTIFHVGGGGEGLLYKGLGAGGEVGYLSAWEYKGSGVGLLSANGSYHFGARTPGRKVAPFVTAGYSLAFRNGHANLANFGCGIHYWFTDRMGLRTEFRDHVYASGGRATHFWGFRLGLALR